MIFSKKPKKQTPPNIFQTRYIILVLLVYDILTNPLHNILKERSVFSYADLNHFVVFQTTSPQNISSQNTCVPCTLWVIGKIPKHWLLVF